MHVEEHVLCYNFILQYVNFKYMYMYFIHVNNNKIKAMFKAVVLASVLQYRENTLNDV